jgi:hypothetical protein
LSILREDQHEVYFDRMLASSFGTVAEARNQPPLSGVYSFFHQDAPIYIGRTNKRGLGPRMKNHLTQSHNQAVLAFKLAKKKLGFGTVYSGEGTRKKLMLNPNFLAEFREQIAYVANLSVRFVEITNSDDQYVFEYYASKRLNTPYNDFDTH